jgi:predicted glycosyltransferase
MPEKLLFYSHNGRGLGHVSIQVKIANSLQAEIADLSILLVTGSSVMPGLRLARGVDFIKLPRLNGFGGTCLSLPPLEVRTLRERIILETALTYRPRLLLVDLVPGGKGGELLPTLAALKRAGDETKLVLGLRDIVTTPEFFETWWRERLNAIPLLEEVYDEIWVYGCREIFDPIKEYRLPDAVAQKMRFCGYLGVEPPTRSVDEIRRDLGVARGSLVLVTFGGGGRDGFPALETYLEALTRLPAALGVHSILVTGVDMPRDQTESLRVRCDHLTRAFDGSRPVHLLDFSDRLLEYMAASDAVVAGGGYNTVTEVISLEKPALIVPLVTPTPEQELRARLFEERGFARVLHPERLSPETMADEILRVLDASRLAPERRQRAQLDLGGLHQVKSHVLRLLDNELGKD